MLNSVKFVFVLFLASLLSACGQGPRSVAIDYTQAVAEGKINEAIGMMDPAVLVVGEAKVRAALSMQKRAIDAAGGIKNISVDNEKTDGDGARVALKIQYKDGRSEIQNMKLRRIDGKWKVSFD